MTIDEAIECERNHRLYPEYHEQLAEWLEELKDYRDKNKMVVRVDVEKIESISEKIEELSEYAECQYNKAIDDFVKLAKEHDFKYENDDISKSVIDIVEFFAELLKEGANNGTDNQ